MAFDQSPDHIARILSHSRLFYGMPPASLYDLISHAGIETFEASPARTTQIRPNELRVILEGDLHILSDGTVMGRGNFIGETALLDLAITEDLDSTRVRSMTGCTCLVVSAAELNSWMERHPALRSTLYRHLAQELFNRCSGAA